MENKVYSGWAFKENGITMSAINKQIYQNLKSKIKMCYVDFKTKILDCTQKDLEQYCCITPDRRGYGHIQYRILSNPHNLSYDELALACDGGNLCYGYRQISSDTLAIYID